MRYKKHIILTLFILLMLQGCSKNTINQVDMINQTAQTDENVPEEGNPFDLEAMEGDNQVIDASYGYTITNMDIEKRIITYDGKEIQVDFQFDNSGQECEIGMFLFVDGIVQPYYLLDDTEKDIVKPIRLMGKTKNDFKVRFEPILGIEGENHKVFFSCMYEPNYRPTAKYLGFGNYHNVLPMYPWSITYKGKNFESNINNKFTISDLSDNIKETYIRKNTDGSISNRLENSIISKILDEADNEISEITLSEDKINLKLQLFGGKEIKYRVSAYVNNQLVNAFNNMPYIDLNIEKNKVSEANINIDYSDLELEKYNNLYLFVVPIDDDFSISAPLIDKTSSIILIN